MSTAPKAEILNLAEMVSYQTGSVVSRQITKADAGNVTLFAFDKGQELSEHTAPFDALVQVVEGGLEVTIGGNPVTVDAGSVVLMPANVPHALRASSDSIMLLVMLLRAMKGHFTPRQHFAFEAAAWYWHFVDVVWLGLFIFVYWL